MRWLVHVPLLAINKYFTAFFYIEKMWSVIKGVPSISRGPLRMYPNLRVLRLKM